MATYSRSRICSESRPLPPRFALGPGRCSRQSRRHKLTGSIDDLDNFPGSWLDENHLRVDDGVPIVRRDLEFARNRVKRYSADGNTVPTVTGWLVLLEGI